MAYDDLLVHTVRVERLNVTDDEGAPQYNWTTVASGIPCRLDLSYIRQGKDAGWVPEAGRSVDRSGVLFVKSDFPGLPGDRVVTTGVGPQGTFEVQGTFDEVPDRWGNTHHVEVGVKEVAKPLEGP